MTRFEIQGAEGILTVRGEWHSYAGEYYVRNLTALPKPRMRKLLKMIRLEMNDEADREAMRDAWCYLNEVVPRQMGMWLKKAEREEKRRRALYMDEVPGTKADKIAYANLQAARTNLEMAQTRIKRLPILIEIWKEVFADELQ